MGYELAEVNIARMKAPIDDPSFKDFVDALESVNALADAAPGFVWRLQTEDDNAISIRAFDWDVRGTSGLLINMSSWTSVETLAAFTYSPGHLAILKRRREWFHRVKDVMTALWWCHGLPADTRRRRREDQAPARPRADARGVHAEAALPRPGRGRRRGPRRRPGLALPGLSQGSSSPQ